MTIQTSLFEENKIDEKKYDAKTYTGIYGVHKYWSKKPYNIIRHFILKYSKEGEIILDPFCGSGISVIESVYTKRKAIGVDINPAAIFITKQMINKVSAQKLLFEFTLIESKIKEKINSFYKVKRHNQTFIGSHFLWENGKLCEVRYESSVQRKKTIIIDHPTSEDIELAESFTYNQIESFYPKAKFFNNSRINTKSEQYVYELFTPRNLLALSILIEEIEKINDADLKELFKFCFTAAVGQASKMVFVIKRRGKFNGNIKFSKEKKEVGSWVIGYWVPKEHFEINVWNCFENRFRRILKAKKEQEKANYETVYAHEFNELNKSKNLLLVNSPAQTFLRTIPENSIDYIITDPPHGNRQPYLELSLMWNSWLKKETNFEEEIVISEAKERNKDSSNYFRLLDQVFSEIHRILKPERFFSLMFNSLNDETWINLITTLNNLNFTIENIETMGYSANSVIQDTRGAGLKTDFILTFKKLPSNQSARHQKIIIEDNIDRLVHKVEFYLRNNVRGLETYQILNFLISDLLRENKFFKLSLVLNILKSYFKKNKNKWVLNGAGNGFEG